jgi:hypothetical protein
VIATLIVCALGGCGAAGVASTQTPPPAPALSLTANPTSVANGASATLSWTSSNTDSCTASGAWSGSKPLSGTADTGPLVADATFTLMCTGAGGSAQQSASVAVAAVPPPQPMVTLTANPTAIPANGTTTLTWSSTNATACTASGAWSGSKALSGSQQVGPLAGNATFTLTCTSAGGSARQDAQVSVSGSGAGITGAVDSGLIDSVGDNRVYVFAGSVTPHDRDGGTGDPVALVPVIQDDNACTFHYQLSGLAAGTYTLAFTSQAQNDRPGQTDSIAFAGTAVVTLGSSPVARDFSAANILHVGPGRQFATVRAAAASASDGSVIEVDAGQYNDDIVVWRRNRITVRGVGGQRATIVGTSVIPFVSGDDLRNGKGLWVVQGRGMRVENIEFSGARVADGNGAGIRNEGTNLTVCNGYFHDSENGFLGGAYGTLLIEYSEFARNGAGDGQTHNIYVDGGSSTGDRLVFRSNYSHHARIGHLLKTRARENYIYYNRLMDEADGTSSYTIDIPEGGLSFVIGNLLQQGPDTDNSAIMSYGAEGLTSGRTHRLYVINNTFVNDRGSGTFVSTASGTETVRLVNNLFIGGGTVSSGRAPQSTTNLAGGASLLIAASTFDYRLASTAAGAIDAGTAPGAADGVDLTPVYEYVHPARRQPRPTRGTIDIGAYELAP